MNALAPGFSFPADLAALRLEIEQAGDFGPLAERSRIGLIRFGEFSCSI